MSKYDAEFNGLSHYALLGRVRQLLIGYRFTNSRRGRRANWMARAIEEWAYREQESMIDVSDNPPMPHQASQASACRVLEQLSMRFECDSPNAPGRNVERIDAPGKSQDLRYISSVAVAP